MLRSSFRRPVRLLALAALPALVLLLGGVPGGAAAATGGAAAEFDSGGAADGGAAAGALPFGTPAAPRPVARVFRVTPGSLLEGRVPRIRVRIDRPGARRVVARVVVLATDGGRVAARLDLGRVRTGRTVAVTWPRGRVLRAGTYVVRLHAKDADGGTLVREGRTTGKTTLEVRPRPRPEKPQPAPQPQPTPPAPVPAPSGSSAGVFPVAGAWSFGGAGGRFGADRGGRRHEGQDLTAAAGVPVVAPLAGTVTFVDFQAGGAGHYVVMTADDGRTLFFAHLQTGSITVRAGQRVAAATTLGRVGSTGSSSGPHLHFEIWLGGWRHQGGRPIDPLPQLRAWAR